MYGWLPDYKSERIIILTVPVAVDREAEGALREVAFRAIEELTRVGRDAISRHWHRIEHPLA